MKKNKYLFILKFIIAGFLLAQPLMLLSQSNTPKENLKEFNDVQVYKPSAGFLTVKLNWKVETNNGIEEKIFLPYEIYDSRGELYQKIYQSYYEPITITLPAGTYYIKTKDITGAGNKFGVEIQSGKTTLVE